MATIWYVKSPPSLAGISVDSSREGPGVACIGPVVTEGSMAAMLFGPVRLYHAGRVTSCQGDVAIVDRQPVLCWSSWHVLPEAD